MESFSLQDEEIEHILTRLNDFIEERERSVPELFGNATWIFSLLDQLVPCV